MSKNFTFIYKNKIYDRIDIERLLDSEVLFQDQITRWREDREKNMKEIAKLKDDIAILTHRKS